MSTTQNAASNAAAATHDPKSAENKLAGKETESGRNVSHATGNSKVPEAIQRAVPESVENVLPDAIHPTAK
jgi:hypothetical protein